VFLEGESGQLFRDIAIAVVFAITLSMFVSMSVIPMFAASLFGKAKQKKVNRKNPLAVVGSALSNLMMRGVSFAIRNWATRILTVGALVVLAVISVKGLMPKMEYLPQGNRNFVMSLIVPPPGLSHEERKEIGGKLFKKAGPYIGKEDHNGMPGILNMFYVGRSRYMFTGAMATDWTRAGELVPLFKEMVRELPGMYGVAMQVGIFQTRLARGRTVDIDISGSDLTAIVRSAGMMFMKIRKAIPGAQVRPVPSIELMYPEVNIIPNRDRLRASGMSSMDLGIALDVLMDGRDIGDFKAEGQKKIDLVLKTAHEEVRTPEDLFNKLIATPSGKVVPVSSLAALNRTTGITRIRHLERSRTVTLQVTPPLTVALESAIETIEKDVTGPMQAGGKLKDVDLRISGAAGKLTVARGAMQWNFVLAAIIAYLLMASLFGNFIYPLIIMLTVPLAGAGGFMGLWLLNRFITPQPMDILTMLGFVILIGVVVNNAILIVHQALNNVRDRGMKPKEAVLDSTRSRLRPIYMSAATSIFGMLPLVIFPGAGTELYKGLGSVILGGIAVSTVFTVFVIPSILMFAIKMENPRVIEEPE
ncbi:MAG: efflux RND transporter permease subunit, partial [Desulfobacterales bacterium]|nr:efflux RND transporter permease subunit [Desulfobacterales bacterium]